MKEEKTKDERKIRGDDVRNKPSQWPNAERGHSKRDGFEEQSTFPSCPMQIGWGKSALLYSVGDPQKPLAWFASDTKKMSSVASAGRLQLEYVEHFNEGPLCSSWGPLPHLWHSKTCRRSRLYDNAGANRRCSHFPRVGSKTALSRRTRAKTRRGSEERHSSNKGNGLDDG